MTDYIPVAAEVLLQVPRGAGMRLGLYHEEITDEVFEANADMIFDEAENRLHMQKAILEWVFEAL